MSKSPKRWTNRIKNLVNTHITRECQKHPKNSIGLISIEVYIGHVAKQGSKKDYEEKRIDYGPVHLLKGQQVSKVIQATYPQGYCIGPSKAKSRCQSREKYITNSRNCVQRKFHGIPIIDSKNLFALDEP